MATEVQIVEQALRRIGLGRALTGNVDGTLANCTDSSAAKEIAEEAFDSVRRRVLVEAPWTFARKFVALTQIDDNEDADGDLHPWGSEWLFVYAYPSDCLRARRFVGDRHLRYWTAGSDPAAWGWWDARAWAFVVRMHESTKRILANVDADIANLEYTEDVTDVQRFPADAASATAWLLASELAPSLKVEGRVFETCLAMWEREAWKAASHFINEERPQVEPDGDWLTSRGGR